MLQTLKKLFYILNPDERRSAILLLVLVLIMALLEMIGIASIFPFIAVLTSPDIIETNQFLKYLYKISLFIGVQSRDQFTLLLGVSVFFLLILSTLVKTFTSFVQIRFIQIREYSISKRLFENYLHRPFSWYLNSHSAENVKNILSEVNTVLNKGMAPMLEFISKSIVALTLISLLLFINIKIALIVGLTLGGIYLLIYFSVGSYLNNIGKKRLLNNQRRFTIVNEAFGAIKEIKINNLENTYVNLFSIPAKKYAKNHASATVVSQLPRYALEAVSFGGIILLILFLMFKTGNLNNALPIISLYAYAGYRLIPALHQIYVASSQIKFIRPAVDKLQEDLSKINIQKHHLPQSSLQFKKYIFLKEIDYYYPFSKNQSLKNINISINANTTIGLIGPTGSGKSTLANTILGLLDPSKGKIEIDDQIISKSNISSYQSLIGYVPQHIYLIDDSIAANIAFAKKTVEINYEKIKRVSKIANLDFFIEHELPNKYSTTIGERGIRLSGGQIQRIGIARALYNDPKILILDEATSALDSEIESKIMKSLNEVSNNITIIIIAHRLNTLKYCDKIYKLNKGEVVFEGSYSDVMLNNI